MRYIFRSIYALGHVFEAKIHLEFARQNLSKEHFDKLYRSRRGLMRFQVIPWILFAVGILCAFLFVPAQEVPYGHASMRETVLLFGTVCFIFFYMIWIILSQFVVGQLWHKYVKWFRKSGSMDELYQLLKEGND